MNDSYFNARGIAIALLALLFLALLAGPSFAATSIEHSQAPVCVAATFFQEVAGNRTKIIQMSIVFVLVGIALLFKK